MQLLGNDESKTSKTKHVDTLFFLDECLPWQIADLLKQVGYPITSWKEEFQSQQGYKDSPLIQYLGAKKWCWITKDDEAKKEHQNELMTAQISVVWVRGLARQKNQPQRNIINTKDLHRMLTDKLDDVRQIILASKKPQYFLLFTKLDGTPVLKKIGISDYFNKDK